MDQSSSRDCNKGEERASSLPKKRRRIAKSTPAKPKERKRGLGIAKLERMRVEEEMKAEEKMKEYFKEALSQPPIHGDGIQGLSTLIGMTHGAREDISGRFKIPMIRSPSTSRAASYVNPNRKIPTTLHLFEAPDHKKDGYIDLKKKDDDNLSKESTCDNFNGRQDLDLNLKL